MKQASGCVRERTPNKNKTPKEESEEFGKRTHRFSIAGGDSAHRPTGNCSRARTPFTASHPPGHTICTPCLVLLLTQATSPTPSPFAATAVPQCPPTGRDTHAETCKPYYDPTLWPPHTLPGTLPPLHSTPLLPPLQRPAHHADTWSTIHILDNRQGSK